MQLAETNPSREQTDQNVNLIDHDVVQTFNGVRHLTFKLLLCVYYVTYY